jgi:hypothetical protein
MGGSLLLIGSATTGGAMAEMQSPGVSGTVPG